jgi:REP element-mobilizing transposase RayT
MRRRSLKQLALPIRTWGGTRRGAGRKPDARRTSHVSHLARPSLAWSHPLHVTIRVRAGAWNLRGGRVFKVVNHAFKAAREKFGMRLCQFSVMRNHVHLLVEASDRRALSRGMQGLGIRLAKALNKLMGAKGTVYADRYHAHVLKTPSEVAQALNYVLSNAVKHGLIRRGPDPCSSEVQLGSTAEPETWLLRGGWRRARRPSRGP